jgi:heme exporter protein C
LALRQARKALPLLTLLGMVAALYGAFLHAPEEKTMGDIQRIFYFHVSSWWIAGLAFLVVFAGSVAFLTTGERKYDTLALASAEVGVVFTTLGLITGPLWAKPVWGIFWTWDARLTTALVLWLIYVSYLMLRHFLPDEEKRARLAAVAGIIGFLDVPIVYMSIRWWRTQHPAPVIMGGEGSGLDPMMAQGLMMGLAGFLFLYLWLLERRVALERSQQEIDFLYKQLESRGAG